MNYYADHFLIAAIVLLDEADVKVKVKVKSEKFM